MVTIIEDIRDAHSSAVVRRERERGNREQRDLTESHISTEATALCVRHLEPI